MQTKAYSPFAFLTGLGDTGELLYLSLKLQLGHRFWLYPLLPLIWPLFQLFLGIFDNADDFGPGSVQNTLIGVPLYMLAIAIGMQIISTEIEQRTLEVCYTVPGGAKRIWLSKLISAALLLVVALLLLAVVSWFAFTHFPLAALLRSLQGALFYLALSMALGAWLRNKMTAGLISMVILFFNGALFDFGENGPSRFSPLFNPYGLEQSMSSEELVYWMIQNHIGFALFILTLIVLTFSRVERRELMLSDD